MNVPIPANPAKFIISRELADFENSCIEFVYCKNIYCMIISLCYTIYTEIGWKSQKWLRNEANQTVWNQKVP